jgi:hypothetical protein
VADVNKAVLQILESSLDGLQRLKKPLPGDVEHQLIHGDLTGNVLFDEEHGSPPGIIDLTPYWRPAAYAEAIVVVDGLTWHGQGRSLVDLYGIDEFRIQLLIRAMYWRNLTWAIDSNMDWIEKYFDKADFQGALSTICSCTSSSV